VGPRGPAGPVGPGGPCSGASQLPELACNLLLFAIKNNEKTKISIEIKLENFFIKYL
jgi:hypothetical protein